MQRWRPEYTPMTEVHEIESDQPEWTTDSYPLKSKGRYQNPWNDWAYPRFTFRLVRFFLSGEIHRIPRTSILNNTLPIQRPNLSEFSELPSSGIRYLWIGHSTSLVQFDGVTFLTDPIFSRRCSPVQCVGPKRYRPLPCSVNDLPHLDFVLISHNHYDHLDLNSVKSLHAKYGLDLQWFVPLGLKRWMEKRGCKNVIEMTWWQEHMYDENAGFKVVCTPCLHWCKRTLTDDNKALWCSWTVIGPKQNFYFAGDTGYCPVFKEIGNKYGPFTLATLPIGAYHPRWLLKNQHVDPAEAVDIHVDIKAELSIAIHWGTFNLGYEFYLDPQHKLVEALEAKGVDPSTFITVGHGEVRNFDSCQDAGNFKYSALEGLC